MRKHIIILVALFVFVSFQTYCQDWDLEKDRDGVQVYTRKVSNSNFKEYRAMVEVRATFNEVIDMLYDVKSREVWLYNTPIIEEVQRTDSTLCIYNRVDAPWPVSDRDNITCFYPMSSRDG